VCARTTRAHAKAADPRSAAASPRSRAPAGYGRPALVKLLLDAGASAAARNANGKTAADLTCARAAGLGRGTLDWAHFAGPLAAGPLVHLVQSAEARASRPRRAMHPPAPSLPSALPPAAPTRATLSTRSPTSSSGSRPAPARRREGAAFLPYRRSPVPCTLARVRRFLVLLHAACFFPFSLPHQRCFPKPSGNKCTNNGPDLQCAQASNTGWRTCGRRRRHAERRQLSVAGVDLRGAVEPTPAAVRAPDLVPPAAKPARRQGQRCQVGWRVQLVSQRGAGTCCSRSAVQMLLVDRMRPRSARLYRHPTDPPAGPPFAEEGPHVDDAWRAVPVAAARGGSRRRPRVRGTACTEATPSSAPRGRPRALARQPGRPPIRRSQPLSAHRSAAGPLSQTAPRPPGGRGGRGATPGCRCGGQGCGVRWAGWQGGRVGGLPFGARRPAATAAIGARSRDPRSRRRR
jgi:hypothetical protein